MPEVAAHEIVSLRVDVSLLKTIDRLAEEEDRSRSNMIIQLVRKALEKPKP
jgi:metal-responsive CopG/Arc/MetJ family transcriptional regulator